MSYSEVIDAKRRAHVPSGFAHEPPTGPLFPHQRDLVRWACKLGKAAVFADTGLGKTRIQLAWANAVAGHTDGTVLVLAPLAVGAQTIAEASEMGVGIDGRIQVLNYERLHHIDPCDYSGVVLDESSILKSYDGKTRTALIDAFQRTPYRLACTATPAPNDHTELGNHAEFLGVCTRQEMLAEYFVHDGDSSAARGWRLKGHARAEFWRWVSTWACMVRLPSDLGHDDSRYLLPELRQHEERVSVEAEPEQGMLFALPAMGLADVRKARRDTLDARCDKAAEIARRPGQCIVWCELNDESSAVADAVADAVEVTGSMDPDKKAEAMMAFARGDIRALVTKPSIAGFGMNWQRCSRMVFVGSTYSYEQYYQAVRRCWRFGQTKAVDVHLVITNLDGHVVRTLMGKADAADAMAREMMASVRGHQLAAIADSKVDDIPPPVAVGVPHWLGGEG